MKNEDDFLANYFNFGLVVKGDLKDINKLKKHIVEELYNMKIIYQTISTNPLKVEEDK